MPTAVGQKIPESRLWRAVAQQRGVARIESNG